MLCCLVTIFLLGFAQGHKDKDEGHCSRPDEDGLIVSPYKNSYDNGETIGIACKDGYEIKAEKLTSTCEPPGFFEINSKFVPSISGKTCKEKPRCEYPDEPGVILTPYKAHYDVGDVASLSCANGYKLKGAMNRTCQMDDGLFSWLKKDAEFYPEVDDDVCEKIPTCKGPGEEEGLIVSQGKDVYYEGDELKFSCEKGFTLVGPKSAVCTKVRSITAITTGFKKLKFQPSIKDEICKKIPTCEPPDEAGLKYSPKKPGYSPGETVTLSCEEGYEFTGEPSERVVECKKVVTLTAIKTGFKGMRFRPRISSDICKKTPHCDTPTLQPGMILLPRKKVHYVGDKVEIVCAGGYELIGPPYSVCTKVRSITAVTTGFKKMKFVPEIPDRACKEVHTVFVP